MDGPPKYGAPGRADAGRSHEPAGMCNDRPSPTCMGTDRDGGRGGCRGVQQPPIMTATTPVTTPFNAQTAAALHRAVVSQRQAEMVTRHPKTNAWWRFR